MEKTVVLATQHLCLQELHMLLVDGTIIIAGRGWSYYPMESVQGIILEEIFPQIDKKGKRKGI